MTTRIALAEAKCSHYVLMAKVTFNVAGKLDTIGKYIH